MSGEIQDSQVICDEPWTLVWGQPYIDAERLVSAIVSDLQRDLEPDFRKRLLVRDAMIAIRSYWGSEKFANWLESCPVKSQICSILEEKLGKKGYHGIRRRLVASPGRNQLEQVFDLLGRSVVPPLDVYIAGSIPTLLQGLTARPTDDIDFVDEVPREIREQRATIKKIAKEYGLKLGHVQSHYLPCGWKERCQSMGSFGGIRVYLVDQYDIFVSKLSSKKEKHKDDLRVLSSKLDKDKAKLHLFTYGNAFLDDKTDRTEIEENWKFLYREPLNS